MLHVAVLSVILKATGAASYLHSATKMFRLPVEN